MCQHLKDTLREPTARDHVLETDVMDGAQNSAYANAHADLSQIRSGILGSLVEDDRPSAGVNRRCDCTQVTTATRQAQDVIA